MLSAGTKLGPYEVTGPAGKGGMGEVYRARDTRLDRTVAIKVLPAELSSDSQRRQRFEMEARVISRVSHPHICNLLDVGHLDGVDYLVMEYLEGENLQQRIDKGALPLDQVVRYGSEIAEALNAAHRQGIVHRDLKPGNIMLTKSGSKLLDFGLARLTKDPSAIQADVTHLAAQTTRVTEEGTILGTWQYMAPEQLEGRDADARSDIFALGAVMFEMAAGRPAFVAKNRASLIAAILSFEPPAISSSQKMSPPALDRLVKKCLEKDPEERWQSAHDVASELKWIAQAGAQPASGLAIRKNAGILRLFALPASALILLAALLLAFFERPRSPQPGAAMRLALLPPDSASFSEVVLSPDGGRLAFSATGPKGKQGIWIRPLDSQTAQLVPGTDDAYGPFWSPDGRYIGFFASGKLKRVDASGGVPEILCSVEHAGNGAWSPEGVVLFSADVYHPIRQISLSDCSIKPVTQMDASIKEIANGQSRFLPDGRHFLWVSNRLLPEKGLDIYVSSLDSEQRRLLVHNAAMPAYVAGYLFFAREGKVMAQGFNAKQLRTQGEPFPVVPERVSSDHFDGTAAYSVSERGLVVYLPDIPQASQLQWRDRSGKPIGNLAESGFNRLVQLSPDGSKVLMAQFAPETRNEDLWIYDLQHGGQSRFTFNPIAGSEARWSPDGRQIVYLERRGGELAMLRKAWDGSGSVETVYQQDHWLAARALSPDGQSILYESIDPGMGVDLWRLSLTGDRKPTPFLQTPFNEGNASVSPDGRWVTYVSNKSGKLEIYARPFPGPGADVQISSGTATFLTGGSPLAVHWRGDGKELFYLSADSKVTSVAVNRSGTTFQAGTPQPLFAIPPGSQFDVTKDGQRFLVNARAQGSESEPLSVILNWKAEHKSE